MSRREELQLSLDNIEIKIDKLIDKIKAEKKRGNYIGELWVKVLRLQEDRDRLMMEMDDG